MHTTQVDAEWRKYRIHHHSDWSGEAILTGGDGEEIARIPGAVFLAIGRNAFLSEAASAIERALDELGQ